MYIRTMAIWQLNVPFTMPVKHNLAHHVDSNNIVVRLTSATGLTGYGEGIPRDFVTGEHLAASVDFLQNALGPELRSRDFSSPAALRRSLADLWQETGAAAFPAAFCALETALLDVAGQTWDVSLADLLGLRPEHPAIYSAVLPLASPEKMLTFLHLVKHYKIKSVKIKVGCDRDHQNLALARRELGPDVDIRVDANAAWTPSEAIQQIRSFAPYRLSAVEQPVAKEDIDGLRRVREAVNVPLIADESLCTWQDAETLIKHQSCQIFNLRLSKCGGLTQAIRLGQRAREAGLLCQLGSHVGETSILAAAGRHFATGTPGLRYLEGSLAPLYLRQDPVAASVGFGPGGVGPALTSPGLGVQVLEQKLQQMQINHSQFSVS